jgi:hypothetical protein
MWDLPCPSCDRLYPSSMSSSTSTLPMPAPAPKLPAPRALDHRNDRRGSIIALPPGVLLRAALPADGIPATGSLLKAGQLKRLRIREQKPPKLSERWVVVSSDTLTWYKNEQSKQCRASLELKDCPGVIQEDTTIKYAQSCCLLCSCCGALANLLPGCCTRSR